MFQCAVYTGLDHYQSFRGRGALEVPPSPFSQGRSSSWGDLPSWEVEDIRTPLERDYSRDVQNTIQKLPSNFLHFLTFKMSTMSLLELNKCAG